MFRVLVVCAFACAAASAAKKCSTKCSDVEGDSVLTFKAEDVVLKTEVVDNDGYLTDHTAALAKALEDLKDNKLDNEQDLNMLMDNVADQYAQELQKVNSENTDKYGKFMDNHEGVGDADVDELSRLVKLKDASQDCQSKGKVMRTKATDEDLGGWDIADEDGLIELEGNDLGGIAIKHNNEKKSDEESECLPALIDGCPRAQVTDKVWGYDYDYVTHAEQAEAVADAGKGVPHEGLQRVALRRQFVDPACANVIGSSCNTACPSAQYEHFTPGKDVTYTCSAGGKWKAELKAYSKIKVFTHLTEQELDEWAAYQGIKVDSTYFTSKWPKMLNLDNDLNDHDPIATLQSYLNYRGIDCDVWSSKFVGDDESDPNKISQMRTDQEADGASLFITLGDNFTASTIATAADNLKGTDYVMIPPHLCTSEVRVESGDNGGAYFIPGKYNFKVKGGAKVLQVVYTNKLCHGGTWSPGNYATRYSGVGGWNPEDCKTKLPTDTRSHGGQGCSSDIFGVAHNNGHCWCVPKSGRWNADTEDCPSFNYGTAHTWKLVVGLIDKAATLGCDNKYEDVLGTELSKTGNYDPNYLTPAGTGLPKKFAKRNSDPAYNAAKGWFFRTTKDDGSAWEFIKQGMDGVELFAEDEAEGEGWSNTKITDTKNMGKLHGPFAPQCYGRNPCGQVARNAKVEKNFAMPVGATTCTVKFRFMRQWTWDNEYAYVGINGKTLWTKIGQGSCDRGEWKQGGDLTEIWGNNNHDCYLDGEVTAPCPAGEDFKVQFSSSMDQWVADESWAFQNLKILVAGIDGPIDGLTVHHYDVEKEGNFGPNGKSDYFDWKYSAKQAEVTDCSANQTVNYAHKTYASYENLKEECRTDLEMPGSFDKRVSMDRIIAWWMMDNFDEDKWVWESVVEHYDTGEKWMVDFVNKGNLKVAYGGEGAHDEYPSLEGDTNSDTKISWGNIVQDKMSFCTTSSYKPSGGSTGRVFRGARSNWLHGHWAGYTRTSHYDGWVLHPYYSPSGQNARYKKDWIVMCQSSKGDAAGNGNGFAYGNIYGWNGDYSKIDTRGQNVYGSRWNQNELVIGRCGRSTCGCCTREESGFRVAEVIAWNRGMGQDELKLMMRYLMERLTGEVPIGSGGGIAYHQE